MVGLRRTVRERTLAVLRGDEEPTRALRRVLRAARPALPPEWLAELEALPFAADRARLRHWLLGCLEQAPRAPEPDLRFRLAHASWHGRVEGCDLELDLAEAAGFAGGERGGPAGSVVLNACARIAARCPAGASGDEAAEADELRALLAEDLPLAWAALLVRALTLEIDPQLVLAGHAARHVSVGFDAGPSIELGVFDAGGWRDV